jgi:hypothetical protein
MVAVIIGEAEDRETKYPSGCEAEGFWCRHDSIIIEPFVAKIKAYL